MINQLIQGLGDEPQVFGFGEPMPTSFPEEDVDVVGAEQLHQLQAAIERNDFVVDAVDDSGNGSHGFSAQIIPVC